MSKQGLNSNQLKMIAIIAMTIDHLTSVIFPGYPKDIWILGLHVIGRFAMPIFCFSIAEGYHYTHNIKRYMFRLFLFAFISHFCYNFAFGIPFIPFQTSVFNQTSVIWPFAWSLVALIVLDSDSPKIKGWMKQAIVLLLSVVTFCADWSSIAMLVIIGFVQYRGNFKKQMQNMMFYIFIYSVVYFLFIDKVYGALQMMTCLTIPIIRKYNGQRGSWKGMKWFFYLYYPGHLLICGLVRVMLHGNIGVMIGG